MMDDALDLGIYNIFIVEASKYRCGRLHTSKVSSVWPIIVEHMYYRDGPIQSTLYFNSWAISVPSHRRRRGVEKAIYQTWWL